MITSGFNALLHRPGLRAISVQTLQEYQDNERAAFYKESVDRPFVEVVYRSRLSVVPKAESELAPSRPLTFQVGQPFRVRFASWRGVFTYTAEAAADDQYNTLRQAAAELALAMRRTWDLLAADIFNFAAEASRIGGWDRKPLAHTAHNLVGTSATYSNLAAAAAGPSYTLLDVIYSYFRRVPTDEGFPAAIQRIWLYVPVEDEPAWRRLLLSTADPTSANANVLNPYQGLVERIIPTPFLRGFTAVAVGDPGNPDSLVWYNRTGVMIDTWTEREPDAIKHRIWWKGALTWKDARRVLFIPRA